MLRQLYKWDDLYNLMFGVCLDELIENFKEFREHNNT